MAGFQPTYLPQELFKEAQRSSSDELSAGIAGEPLLHFSETPPQGHVDDFQAALSPASQPQDIALNEALARGLGEPKAPGLLSSLGSIFSTCRVKEAMEAVVQAHGVKRKERSNEEEEDMPPVPDTGDASKAQAGDALGKVEMLQLQMALTDMQVNAEIFGKFISKAVQNAESLLRMQ